MKLFGVKMNYDKFIKKVDREIDELEKQKKDLEHMLAGMIEEFVKEKVKLMHTFDEVLKDTRKITRNTDKIYRMRKELEEMLGKEVE